MAQWRMKHLPIPTAVFLLAMLLFLSYTQKINVPCIISITCSGTLRPQGALQAGAPAAGNATTIIQNNDDGDGDDNDNDGDEDEDEDGAGGQEQKQQQLQRTDASNSEDEYPLKAIKDQVGVIRSWAPNHTWAPTCDDGRIFVYELPSKFNKDIMSWYSDCSSDFCRYLRDDDGGLGPSIPKLGRSVHRTHQFSLEPIFHSRVLKHPCRALDPADAALFYVPFYGGLHNFMCHLNDSPNNVFDGLGIQLVEWLEGQRWWRRRHGADHMFVLGMIGWDFRRRHERENWGSNFLLLEQMKAPYRFLIERDPWDVKDIGIPYPSYFHPHGDVDVARWQARVLRARRRTLVAFAGAARPSDATSIRSKLIRQCKSAGGRRCKFLNCGKKPCKVAPVVALMLRSEFCLQPPGDSPTRKSLFDSLASGCIPVLFNAFSAYYQYPWHLPEAHERYSVFITEEEVRKEGFDLVERLRSVGVEQREDMRRYIVRELMPGLAYGDSTARFEKFHDAFDITINSILQKFKMFGY